MNKKFFNIGGIIILIIILLIYFYNQFGQQPKENILITMERTICFGDCPAYKLTIYKDGLVVYEDNNRFRRTGDQKTKISPDQIKLLVDEFYKISFFSLDDNYDNRFIEDLPTTTISITIDGRTKTVENTYGAPEKLYKLEDKIDEITNATKWIELK